MKVGFIGTGAMGRPMARNLVAKGFVVVAYDLDPAALAAAAGLDASPPGSAAAAKQSDIVVTMLPSSTHVESAYLAARGVLEGIVGGRLSSTCRRSTRGPRGAWRPGSTSAGCASSTHRCRAE